MLLTIDPQLIQLFIAVFQKRVKLHRSVNSDIAQVFVCWQWFSNCGTLYTAQLPCIVHFALSFDDSL